MPVIVGAPRSGTTLLRFMLDSHPMLAIPPETGFLPEANKIKQTGTQAREELFRLVTTFPADAPVWPDFDLDARQLWEELQEIEPFDIREGVRAFYRLYALEQEKERYGDKTPIYCEHVGAIEELLPEAHFLHIIRDGRDVALSLRPLWFAPGQDIGTLANYWSRLVRSACEAGRAAKAYMEVRYEELIRRPEVELKRIGAFLDLPYDASMLRYWERTPERLKQHKARLRVNGAVLVSHEQRLAQQRRTMEPPQPCRTFRWKQEMSETDRAEFISYAGDTLEALGYEL